MSGLVPVPEALIAQEPLADRAASRLMVVDRTAAAWQHQRFSEIGQWLRPSDCLVLNDTRVIPARLLGRRPTGGAVELLWLRPGPSADMAWCLSRPARRLTPGARVLFDHGSLEATVEAPGEGGERLVRFHAAGSVEERLAALGQVPLPPYIRRPPTLQDRERYQTVYAKVPGAVAAPTAGLHFTPAMLETLRGAGVEVVSLTLHVGDGTFAPLTAKALRDGRLHPEWFNLPEGTAAAIHAARLAGRRVVAVGTTVCRTLETCAQRAGEGPLMAQQGWTDLFIRPGFRFRVVDALLTNFHLPETSLVLLVAAFAGAALTQRAYAAAVAERYRFYSYGDAMAIA
ncbi:MAG: tRNA preQ1(34) S-adenosylmethionine ribosyltransferase-isomerase QueA [Omnitrophica WOR_2 bacterium RIFCSPHIGHO2_02_FULL_68_15]|nr:MAG: tRNA preQ1(34) S-adenosylmethionine ribosyltransferase-isomerase QueA [Omnitrophica WOR_2 bacterium RIFCSPHIGHO2_02_FULL_68_15]